MGADQAGRLFYSPLRSGGYEIIGSFRLAHAVSLMPPDVELSNVSYPVATRWFGLFANPYTAHTGYDHDDEVLTLVLCGCSGCAR